MSDRNWIIARNDMRYRHSLVVLAGILIGSIAIVAAVNLWFLRRLQSDSLHASAAQAVLELGSELARNLASQPTVLAKYDEVRHWEDFSRLVRALRKVEPSLEYVTVSEGDVILFHADRASASTAAPLAETGTVHNVRIGRRLMATGKSVAPVLTFTVQASGDSTPPRFVQIAMRKEAVSQREERATQVLSLMFRLSLLTLAIAFGLAVLLVVWVFRHEQQRQRRQRDAEHLAFAGILADGIIHDVRNPMSSLRLDIQMLEKEAGKGPEAGISRIAELAARARRTMDRVDLVMREFLYVSRPTQSTRERVDINACIHDCVDLLGPRFEREEIGLQTHLADDLPAIMGHSVGLKRALINVLTNARQASQKGGAVTVSSRLSNAMVVVEVEDQGPGIPEGERKRIFDPFVSGRPGGVGLGLYLAKAAVENSGGTLTVENRAEGGARFALRLPVATVEPKP